MSAGIVAVPTYGGAAVAPRVRTGARTRRRAPKPQLVARERQHHVVSEPLFRSALVRERKRADRFEESFALVLISLDPKMSRTAEGSALIAALAQHQLDTDLIGWYEQNAVIGLLRPLAHQDPGDAAAALAATVRRHVASCLSRNTANGCSINLDVYSPHREVVPHALREPVDRRRAWRQAARRVTKRVLDITGAVALLLALAPVFAVIAALVKLTSRGPVFFRQQRIGEGGLPFRMLKFRTMRVDADESIHKQYVTAFIQSGAAAATDGVFKIVNDPRVTPIGRFLRRSSLDELPQFWNVLTGEMSLVGPRPPLAYEVESYKGWHRRRLLEAKPGITGLWQVTGRSRTTFEEMVRLDLRYAKTHSVWTDVRILLATPRAVVTGKGAH